MRRNELVQLARLCVQEQGGSEAGVKGEASLMLNLAWKHGESVYEYVLNSGWFSKARFWMQYGTATEQQVEWVKEVLVDGHTTLPSYVDEHDCFSDITWISTGDVTDRSAYIKDKTIIHNRYGSIYTFYCFLHPYSDPFGYTGKPVDGAVDGEGVYLRVGD